MLPSLLLGSQCNKEVMRNMPNLMISTNMFNLDIELEEAISEGYYNPNTQALLEARAIAEADSVRLANHLRISLLNPDKLVEKNDLKPITNPIIFQGGNIPTPDGLLSY